MKHKVIVVICAIGLVAGGAIGGYTLKDVFAGDTSEEEANVKIALVNQDTGTGKGTNYSDQLIANLNSEIYQVVPYETAKTGVREGNYGAMIIFPSDLSGKVATIRANDTEKVTLQYSMSEGLTERQYIDGYKKVYDATREFNNRLSKAFVNSVFEQVRAGQGNIAAIDELNQADLAAAADLSVNDFMKSIDYTDIPKVVLELNSLNLKDYKLVNNNGTFAEDVKNLFAGGYETTYNENRAKIADALLKLDEAYNSTNYFYNDLYSDSNMLGSYSRTLTSNYSDNSRIIETYFDNFKNGIPDISVVIPSDDNLMRSEIPPEGKPEILNEKLPSYQEGLGTKYNDEEDFLRQVTEYKEAAEEYADKLEEAKNNLVKFHTQLTEAKDNLSRYKGDVSTYVDDRKSNVPLLSGVSAPKLKIENSELMSTYAEIPGSIKRNKEVMKNVVANLSPKNVSAAVPDALTSGGNNLSEELSLRVSQFREELLQMNFDVDNIQSGNNEQLSDAYLKYNEHVSKVHSESLAGYSDAQTLLSKSVSGFYSLKKENTVRTTGYLSSINGLLTYESRKNTNNSAVIDFISEPLVLEEIYL